MKKKNLITTFNDQDERPWRNIENNEQIAIRDLITLNTYGSGSTISNVNSRFSRNAYHDIVYHASGTFLCGAKNSRIVVDRHVADGTVENLLYLSKSFIVDGADSYANSMAIDSSGAIYVACFNTTANGTARQGILKSHLTQSKVWHSISGNLASNGHITQYPPIIRIDKNDTIMCFYTLSTVPAIRVDYSLNRGATWFNGYNLALNNFPHAVVDAYVSGNNYYALYSVYEQLTNGDQFGILIYSLPANTGTLWSLAKNSTPHEYFTGAFNAGTGLGDVSNMYPTSLYVEHSNSIYLSFIYSGSATGSLLIKGTRLWQYSINKLLECNRSFCYNW